MEFLPTTTDADAIARYERLFAASFPGASHLSQAYLTWLYAKNPAGPVVGFDAYERGELAAHYVCIPCTTKLRGRRKRALLSLNTATHPRYQGRGLFTRLAEMTYQRGADEGYELVYGVANANSTHGFTRKLGFQLVSQLEARVGGGRLGVKSWTEVSERAEFRRDWDSSDLAWRLANPSRPVFARTLDAETTGAWAATGRFGLIAWAEIPTAPVATPSMPPALRPRIFLGSIPEGLCTYSCYVSIPRKLRASPLNLIYKDLSGKMDRIDPRASMVSFLDFDAF